MLTYIAIGLTCLVLMEPVAAGAHRLVMHGRGWAWHRSHHMGRRHDRWEKNDRFPLVFACLTVSAMAVGAFFAAPGLLAAGAGITVYGLAYLVVHDVCVHGRLTGGRPWLKGRWLQWVAECHAQHHRTNGAPFGFLVPIRPRSVGVRQRRATPLRPSQEGLT